MGERYRFPSASGRSPAAKRILDVMLKDANNTNNTHNNYTGGRRLRRSLITNSPDVLCASV